MSAIRNAASRRSRSSQSPYARPTPKKSSWSISNFLTFLNPLRLRSSTTQSEAISDIEDEPSMSHSAVAESLSERGHQMAGNLRTNAAVNVVPGLVSGPSGSSWASTQRPQPTSADYNSHQSFRTSTHYALPVSPSSLQNIETVKEFLTERAGKPITEVEVEGLVSLLDKSSTVEQSTPFRFSSTFSTPDRGVSPVGTSNVLNGGVDIPTLQISSPSPRKTLSRNPNGTYRWQGGGSAKSPRSRNRYSSPAFGPSRSAPDRLVLKDHQTDEPLKGDTKRRRIGQDVGSSSKAAGADSNMTFNGDVSHTSSPNPPLSCFKPVEQLPFPISNALPSTPRTNGPPLSKSDRTSTPSLLRLPHKPTAPAIPSPLRQTWSGSSPAQTGSTTPPQQKQSKAANFMTELIKEVTPPKRPDLSNPYQTASPVGKVGTPPKSRITKKRVRATGKPTIPEMKTEQANEQDSTAAEKEGKVREKVYSPQAIIEATVPKGSKRSRPPAHLEATTFSINVEPSHTKSPGERLAGATPPPLVEEVDDDADEAKRSKKKSKSSPLGQEFVNIIGQGKEDILVEEVATPEAPLEKPKSTILPPALSPSLNGGPNMSTPITLASKSSFPGSKSTSTPKEPSKLRYSYQPEPNNSGPSFTPIPASTPASFTTREEVKDVIVVPIKKPMRAKEAALAIPTTSLPVFVFSVSTNFPPSSNFEDLKAREKAKSLPASSLPHFDLTIETTQCQAATKSSAPPVKGFDWAAAGRQPPSKNVGANWTCSICMLSNPSTAVDKCTVCEAPR